MTEHVPMEKWGQDHWSLLLYVESRCVDHNGRLNPDHMRPSPGQQPVLYGRHQRRMSFVGNYPTKLKDGELEGHGDWDCLEDLRAAKLLTSRRPSSIKTHLPGIGLTGLQELEAIRDGRYRLTKRGLALAAALRARRAQKKPISEFNPSEIV